MFQENKKKLLRNNFWPPNLLAVAIFTVTSVKCRGVETCFIITLRSQLEVSSSRRFIAFCCCFLQAKLFRSEVDLFWQVARLQNVFLLPAIIMNVFDCWWASNINKLQRFTTFYPCLGTCWILFQLCFDNRFAIRVFEFQLVPLDWHFRLNVQLKITRRREAKAFTLHQSGLTTN